jgi:hypothetical protein
MKPKEILLSSACIASCITAICLLIYFQAWPWLIYASVVFATVFLLVAGVLVFWNSAERRAIRNAAIKLIVSGILFIGKAALSGGLRLWLNGKLETKPSPDGESVVVDSAKAVVDSANVTPDAVSANVDGTIGWLLNSDPTVDCLLVIAGVVLCGLGAFLLWSLVNGNTTLNSFQEPQVPWDELQSFKGCVNYLVRQVEGKSPEETADMQEILTDCFFAIDPSDWKAIVERHKLGKRGGKILLMGAVGKLIVEFKELHGLHGLILKPLAEIETRFRAIREV